MPQKRQSAEDSGSGGGTGEKRRRGGAAFRGLVMNVVRANRIENFLSVLEPLLRRIVKEEVERALGTHMINITRQSGSQVYPSPSGSLQLHFRTALCHPIFTGAKIEGVGGSLVVVLLDPVTGYIVTSGPESSLMVEIVVLEGDFESDNEDNWTFEEFNNNIVKEREGKRSLLSGDAFFILDGGTGTVKELSFTDNSSWTRSRKFRLGAMVKNGSFSGIRIQEAKTEPFLVKDHRGELYKKHYPPSLEDEVWRLEKIGKDGAFHKRLAKANINTVQDFLRLLTIDAPRLRSVLGSGMSNKMWEITVEHARKCVLMNKRYVYYDDGQKSSGVVCSEIGELGGLIYEHQYIPVSNLSDTQKVDALKLLKDAYEQPQCVHPYVSEDNLPSVSSVPDEPSLPPNIFDECSSSLRADWFSGSLPSISTPDMFSSSAIECMRNLVDYRDTLHQDPFTPLSPLFEESVGMLFGDEGSEYFQLDPCIHSDNLSADTQTDAKTANAEHLKPRGKVSCKKSNAACSFDTVTTKPVKSGWGLLLSVLSWTFSIKRIVASKRRGKPSKAH